MNSFMPLPFQKPILLYKICTFLYEKPTQSKEMCILPIPKCKDKVVPVPKHHTMKMYRGSRNKSSYTDFHIR